MQSRREEIARMSPEMREAVARIIALAGLGTTTGDGRWSPPNEKWDPAEWHRRVLECVPFDVERRCYETADAILSLLATLGAGEGGLVACTSSPPAPPVSLPVQTDKGCDLEALRADALRYRYLREHRSSHYAMTWEQPAEWSIQWEFQQGTPAERYGTIDTWIDADIARLDEEDRALLLAVDGGQTRPASDGEVQRSGTTEPNPPARPEQGRGGGG